MSKHSFLSGIITTALLVLLAFGQQPVRSPEDHLPAKSQIKTAAILPGATVAIKNVETNVTSTGTTNEEGSYTFPLLQPGRYSLTVTATGFATTLGRYSDQRFEKRTLDVPMQVTGVGEMVEVVSSSAPLETGSVSTGSVISSKQINELPLIDGSPYQLATLAPGISYTGNPAFTVRLQTAIWQRFARMVPPVPTRLRWMVRRILRLTAALGSRRLQTP